MRLLRRLIAVAIAFIGVAATPALSAVEPLEYGTVWYPEQWPEAAWDADLDLMHAAGFTFVRVGEFAWSTIEPSEGRYDWRWLDHAIARAAVHRL